VCFYTVFHGSGDGVKLVLQSGSYALFFLFENYVECEILCSVVVSYDSAF